MKPINKSIAWLRNDLRLHDNEVLTVATEKSEFVTVLYCLDPDLFRKNDLGLAKTGYFRTKFLYESLIDLRESLTKIGGELLIKYGKPEKVIPLLCKEYGFTHVFTSKEIAHEEVSAEQKVEAELWKLKIGVSYFWQQTLVHIEDIPFPVNNLPDIFTQFRKKVEKDTSVRPALPSIKSIKSVSILSDSLPNYEELGLEILPEDERKAIDFKGGETEAIKRLNDYFWKGKHLSIYKETRNGLLGENYSSKFSPWLANGSLSPRYVYQEVKNYEKEVKKNSSTYWLVFELLWRDYFKYVAKKYGNKLFIKGGIKSDFSQEYSYRPEIFSKWIEGKTGVPFIDANMIELKSTGFMSNRGRQNVASFLVKDLKQPWIYGAAYFETALIDYDVCSNWGNWNYIAGVGNDPRENRYFNILSQAKRYDQNAQYIKHWLNELQEVPEQKAHSVWTLSHQEQERYRIKLGGHYPLPVINTSKWEKTLKY